MPGSFMPQDDCFDLFIDYIESDEWLLPIESFIDYFNIAFPTPDPQDHFNEKNKIFQEYIAVIQTNLNQFLREILNYSAE